MLTGVAAGVVDGDGGAGHQFLGHGDVLLLEPGGARTTPEVHHAEDHPARPERHRDQRVDAVVQRPPRSLGVLRPPVLGGVQVRDQDGLAPPQRRRHRRVGHHEPDHLAHRLQGVLAPRGAQRGTAHLADRARGLLAAQHGVEEFHGDEVGHAGDRHLGQLLRRTPYVECGADPHARFVQEREPAPCHLGLPGERPQLGGVTEGGDQPLSTAVRGRGPGVHRQQPVPGRDDLVGRRLGGQQQPRQARPQPQLPHVPLVGVPGQVQQPARLVVGEQDASVAADDQHTLAHRVQHGVVVLVHPGHLGRAETMGLPQQPAADQRRSAGRQQQRTPRHAEQHRHLLVQHLAHVAVLDPGGDHADHAPAGVRHRYDRPHGVAGPAVERLGEHLAHGGPADALGLRADQGGVGVGDPDSAPVEDADEVDAGTLLYLLHRRLQVGGRIRGPQGERRAGRVRERLRHGQGTVLGGSLGVVPALHHQGGGPRHDQDQHDQRLQQEDLRGERADAQGRRKTASAWRPEPAATGRIGRPP